MSLPAFMASLAEGGPLAVSPTKPAVPRLSLAVLSMGPCVHMSSRLGAKRKQSRDPGNGGRAGSA